MVEWTLEEMANLDRRTKKILAKMVVYTPGVMLQGCTCQGKKVEED